MLRERLRVCVWVSAFACVLYLWMIFILIEMCPVSQCEIISYTNWFLTVGISESFIALLSFFLLFILSPSLYVPHLLPTTSNLTFYLCHPSLILSSDSLSLPSCSCHFALIAVFFTHFLLPLSSFLKWRTWIMRIQMSAEIIIQPWVCEYMIVRERERKTEEHFLNTEDWRVNK